MLGFAGISPATLRIYPIETHIAEKVHAYTMSRARPNSRVKDLPDPRPPRHRGAPSTRHDCGQRSSRRSRCARLTRCPPRSLPPQAWETPLTDPHIIKVITAGIANDGCCFYVVKLLEGEPLRAILRRKGKLDMRAAVPTGIDISQALAAAVQQVVTFDDKG